MQKVPHKFTEKREKKTGGLSPHFGDAESKSPHRSELPVEVGLGGATELELLESRSSKHPGSLKSKKKRDAHLKL